MSTYTRILYLIVFGSRKRVRFFKPETEKELFSYVAGISKNKKCLPYKIGGDTNHLHLLVDLHKNIALSEFVREIKKATNVWIRLNRDKYPSFPGWQDAYAAATYPISALPGFKTYIENQHEHHKVRLFEDEYRAFLEEHGIEYDEKYLLD